MDFLQPLGAIVTVMFLLCGVLFVLKKRGSARFRFPGAATAPRRIELIERTVLDPQHALHLVRVGEKYLVLSTSPASCSVVSELP